MVAAEPDDGDDPLLDAHLYADLGQQIIIHLTDLEILDRIWIIFKLRDLALISTEQWYQLMEEELAGQHAALVKAFDRLYEQFLDTLEPGGRY